MSKLIAVAFMTAGLLAFAQDPPKDPPKPAATGLTVTLTLDKDKYVVGDEIQAEVKVENTTGRDVEIAELMYEERSVSFQVKATWAGVIKVYDLAITRPDPNVAMRLALPKVTLANGRSLTLAHRIPTLAAGPIEVTAVFAGSGTAEKSVASKAEVTGTSLTAVLDTTSGAIQLDLDHVNAPANVSNFVTLARLHFYDDMAFHRVVKGSWVQSGCPYGLGIGNPGYSLKGEPSETSLHGEGTVSMSGSDKQGYTGSQFFICLNNLPALDKKFTIIGKVGQASLESVKAIGRVDTDKNTDRPKTDVKIKKVTIAPK